MLEPIAEVWGHEVAAWAPQVLVVEDDDAIRDVLGFVLGDHGLRVHEAGDGRAALELLLGGLRPGLIVLDLVMPVMGGREVLARLRAPSSCWRGIPVLVLSGSVSPALPEGVPVLPKPFELTELLGSVDALLRQGQLPT